MVSWRTADFENKVDIYDPSAGREVGTPTGLVVDYATGTGTIDTNTATWKQYPWNGTDYETAQRPEINGQFSFNISAGDISANSGKRFGISMFVARADVFSPGVVPTPQQIAESPGVRIIRSNYYRDGSDGAGTLSDFVGYTPPFPVAVNTKYWIMVMPVARVPGQSASFAADKPLSGQTYNSMGRARSFWTNRTPTAPTITAPVSGVTIAVNGTFNLSFTPNDPDKFAGSATNKLYTGLAGVQVQYAARPTPENPTPTWIDLPIGNNGATALGAGWAIKDTTAIPADSGAFNLLNNNTIVVRAGSNTIYANQGALPAGEWQIRVRTFDHGTDRLANRVDLNPPSWVTRPLGLLRTPATLTPVNYPADNTSPWSTPVIVLVPSTVPPPIPLSPINSVALPNSVDITLLWQYRNAVVPPLAQTSRTVQYRKVGAVSWTTLVTGASSSNSAILPVSSLVPNTQYEWRVQTTDSSGGVSNYSSVATFWLVPAPVSGTVRPIPTETIDGAELGCGQYRAFIYRRGGKRRVGEIRGFTYLDWGRLRDDISTAKIRVRDWDIDCGNLLSLLKCWAYEVVIFRNNGYSTDRVWEGPITLLTFNKEEVEIDAKDVMGYAYRRIIKQKMSDAGSGNGTTVVSRATRVMQNVFAPDDPNVLPYLTPLGQSDDAMQYRSTPAYSRTAFEEIDDMAANAGLDYTTVGRSILLWGTKHRIGTLPEFTDKDLGAVPIVSEYGMSMANVYAVSDGNGVYGVATASGSGVTENGGVVSGNDPHFGLIEMLSSSWASDSPDDSGTYSQAGLQTIRDSFKGYAQNSIADRYMPGAPVVVRIPDNTTLNPSTVLSIQQLVPGVVIPLRSDGTLRHVVANQKLDAVKVVVEPGKETISITMSPFNRDDQNLEEGA